METNTDPLQVENMSFLLERIGRDCDPLQYLRELTQNAIEAIQKTPESKGSIAWGYDENTFSMTGVKKLCITDNGIGMTGEEMIRYINHLASSSNVQGMEQNFGVGAKISAGVQNPAGMVFMSWKNGIGSKIHFWRDPDTDTYGLKKLRPHLSGHEAYVQPLDERNKPALIGGHGTRVVLLGESKGHNTVDAPEGVPSKSKWIRRFLNTRYATFPQNIQIYVDESWLEREAAYRPGFPVTGQMAYLNSHSDSLGTVNLKGAKAHWWILSEAGKASEVESSGHVAAIYKNEIYEPKTGAPARPILQQFGVTLGTQKVVIYVEPDPTVMECITDTARSRLKLNSHDIPWHEWSTEFEGKMPGELRDYIDGLLARDTNDINYKEAIRKRLQDVAALYDFSAYMPSKKGHDGLASGTKPRNIANMERISKARAATVARKNVLPKEETPPSDPGRDFKDASGAESGKLKKLITIPKVSWISTELGNRFGSHLEDRAAESPRPSILHINADFRGYRDLVRTHQEKWSHIKGSARVVEQTVREWYEQNLIEAVIGAEGLSSSSPSPLSVSEEFLTAASLPRYNLMNNINRVLSRQLGKMARPEEKVALIAQLA